MSTPLRVGIVGCGRIAGNHARAFAAAGATVAACCDADIARARALAAEREIAAAVGGLDELLALGLDAVSVCTPHPAHEEVVVAAAAAGLHVLCEKPIAVDLAAADRMIAATDAAGVTFGVMFQRRLWPAAQRLHAAIADGRIGAPVLGEVTAALHRPADYFAPRDTAGTGAAAGRCDGVLMTQAIHQIDMLCWLMGEPVAVAGTVSTASTAAASTPRTPLPPWSPSHPVPPRRSPRRPGPHATSGTGCR
ncbi:hypothetical protein GCM10023147_50320 [Tsukamurella soli]|uniref:Oxidoreductase family, NAD-binding Rossmann fold n=1 Tax=Tsukamurella soli TaxID=644556 RepID=A0ABP8KI80_9ACTN